MRLPPVVELAAQGLAASHVQPFRDLRDGQGGLSAQSRRQRQVRRWGNLGGPRHAHRNPRGGLHGSWRGKSPPGTALAVGAA